MSRHAYGDDGFARGHTRQRTGYVVTTFTRPLVIALAVWFAGCTLFRDPSDLEGSDAPATSTSGGSGAAGSGGSGGAAQSTSTTTSTAGSGATAGTGGENACGDGDKLELEECDDGNHADGDGCSASCTIECSGAMDPAGLLTVLNGSTGHCYRFDVTDLSWFSAEEKCVEWNGHLAAISSANEQAFIESLANMNAASLGFDHFWIGFSDTLNEGDYVWSTGEAWVYTAWAADQPDVPQKDEDCGGVYPAAPSGWYWHDAPCFTPGPALCERSPGL
jgi:cysteine-rich repeat protein